MKTLNEIADAVHWLAEKKGWHNFEETDGAFLTRAVANAHGEISELWESFRKGELDKPCDKSEDMKSHGIDTLTCIEEEYADQLIRLLDSARRLRVDIYRAVLTKHEYNETRPYRHGGKRA